MTREEAEAWAEEHKGLRLRVNVRPWRDYPPSTVDSGRVTGGIFQTHDSHGDPVDWAPAASVSIGTVWFLPEDVLEIGGSPTKATAVKCECGAAKCGFQTHSSWCPIK